MKAISEHSSSVRFGQFQLDISEERLLKKGLPVRIENHPLQILVALLDHPGEVVNREELCAGLWPDGTYVDFDEGLNTAVKKLRYALGDSAENPVFIETVPRRGYRFIAPVQKENDAEQPDPSLPVNEDGPQAAADSEPLPVARASSTSRWTSLWLIGFGVILLGGCGLLYRFLFPPALQVTHLTRLTSAGRVDPWGRLASDGSRLFFLERDGDHWNARQISVAGGESMPFGPTGRNIRIHAVSNDQSEILFAPFTSRITDLPLWSMPLIGGSPRRVGDILANGAAFSPDGTRIAFTTSSGVFVANRDGSAVHQVANMPESWDIAWSPDGSILRFHAHGPRLWQVTPAGRNLHPFLRSWTAYQGRWTSDGSYYVFTATKDSHTALWAVRESPFLPWLQSEPVQLTFPPLNIGYGLPSRDGNTIYALGGLSEQIDVVRFDPVTHHFAPVIPGLSVKELSYSPDRQWVLYNDWNHLWRSRPDGSDRLQLAGAPLLPGIHFARWSPDSKRVVFNNTVGETVGDKDEIYLVPVDGGTPQRLLPTALPGRLPSWSPDGQTISFSVDEDASAAATAKPGIYLFDLTQGRSTWIPGSDGLAATAWSPDGRFLAAVSEDTSVMKLLDLRTHRWTEIAHGKVISFPIWSADSVLYFEDVLAPGQQVYRFQPGTAGPQRAYSFEDILQGSSALRCGFEGFAPDGSVLVQVSRGGGDVYSLTVNR